ncbi:MAG TPA: ABC transporter ATP-binding protein [Fibrobacteria bacterium]|nr:ABC transporter ATP-binding protein [Fibrobacteria bacterium]
MTPAAQFVGVGHRYDLRKPDEALKGVTFSVPHGGMFGLVGPDGAGKTTLLRALCHLHEPERGEVLLFGKPVAANSGMVRSQLGYLAQRFSLYGDLTVDENISFFGDLYGVPDAPGRGRELLARMGMERFGSRMSAQLSGGMKQKLALTIALLHRPRILVLDEPTNGVDPVSRREFWAVLGDLVSEGMTVLASTPYMDEASRCHRVGLLHEGRLLCEGTVDELADRTGAMLLELIPSDPRRAFKTLSALPEAATLQMRGERIEILADDPGALRSRIEPILSSRGMDVVEWRVRKPDLENAFLELLRREALHDN